MSSLSQLTTARYSANSPFVYEQGELICEKTPLATIAATVGTPVYVYSRADIVARAAELHVALEAGGPSLACYAVKANGNPTILSILAAQGLGADVTSGGELFLALRTGIEPHKIVFSGVGKKPDELAFALHTGIRAIHVESEMELEAVGELAESLQVIAPIGVRANPNVSAETHPYISTGLHEHKFGVPFDRAVTILRAAAEHPRLRPVGLAAHIGSQITDIAPFVESVHSLVNLADSLRGDGIALEYIDAGGGLGIDYLGPAPSAETWIAAISPIVHGAGYELVIEPGRSIVGRAGALLTEVLYLKQQGEKQFVIVDAGMSDLLRPALYQAHHPILPVRDGEGETEVVDVVGPICETSDFIARARALPAQRRGDLLAILHAGAYGFAMSSNYNGHLRPPEVLVEGETFRVIRRRQTYEDLLAGT